MAGSHLNIRATPRTSIELKSWMDRPRRPIRQNRRRIMASSISPLSYLDASPYQSLTPLSSSASAAGASTGVSATAELQALQKQGDFQSFMNDSMAAALLQPADGTNSGTAANTLISNMLQQVLGAYQTQSSQGSSTAGSTSVSG